MLTPRLMLAALPVVAVLLAGAPAALAQDRNHSGQSHSGHSAPMPAPAAQESAATRAFREANDRMHKDMGVAYTGDADVDFLRGMIPHHQGAIDMARIVLAHGADPKVRKLAQDVIAAQEAEITMMKEWLAARSK